MQRSKEMKKLPVTLIFSALLSASTLVCAAEPMADPYPPGVDSSSNEPVSPAELDAAREEGRRGGAYDTGVTEYREGSATIREYRSGGMVNQAEVDPRRGKSYWIQDTDGDGDLNDGSNTINNPSQTDETQMWKLKQW